MRRNVQPAQYTHTVKVPRLWTGVLQMIPPHFYPSRLIFSPQEQICQQGEIIQPDLRAVSLVLNLKVILKQDRMSFNCAFIYIFYIFNVNSYYLYVHMLQPDILKPADHTSQTVLEMYIVQTKCTFLAG